MKKIFQIRVVLILLLAVPVGAQTTNTQSKVPPHGIFISGGEDQTFDKRVYLSIWEKDRKLVVGLVCNTACLPRKKEESAIEGESYIGQNIREVGAGIWEVALKFEASEKKKSKPPADIQARVHLNADKSTIEFGGVKIPIHSATFQEASYHAMGNYGAELDMLFSADKGSNLLWKSAPKDGRDTGWFFLADGRTQTASVKNWHYVVGKSDHEMGGYVQLSGEMTLGNEVAEIRVDVIRTPVSDVSFKLIRKGRAERFTQANDSNLRRYDSCQTGSDSKTLCRRLYSLIAPRAPSCPKVESQFAYLFWDADAPTYSYFFFDEKTGRVLDNKCRQVYSVTAENEYATLRIKDNAGKVSTFVFKEP